MQDPEFEPQTPQKKKIMAKLIKSETGRKEKKCLIAKEKGIIDTNYRIQDRS